MSWDHFLWDLRWLATAICAVATIATIIVLIKLAFRA